MLGAGLSGVTTSAAPPPPEHPAVGEDIVTGVGAFALDQVAAKSYQFWQVEQAAHSRPCKRLPFSSTSPSFAIRPNVKT